MDGMRLIHSGEDWPHERPPCAKDMTGLLEHNEKIVTWVQPVRTTLISCYLYGIYMVSSDNACAGLGGRGRPDPGRAVQWGLLPA